MTRTVVIAGVGPGLGASLALRFAAEGCQVALLARSADYVADLADEIDAEQPGEALAVPTDISDREAVEDAFAATRDAFGPVDILVNHASAASWRGLLDAEPEGFRQALAVNVEGAFHCSQEAVADMVDGDGGTVVFTGATTAVRGREGAVGFSAAKFGARGLAESMCWEIEDFFHTGNREAISFEPANSARRGSTSPTSSSTG